MLLVTNERPSRKRYSPTTASSFSDSHRADIAAWGLPNRRGVARLDALAEREPQNRRCGEIAGLREHGSKPCGKDPPVGDATRPRPRQRAGEGQESAPPP